MSAPAAVSIAVCLGDGDSVAEVGTAYAQTRRGITSTTFRYSPRYLGQRRAFAISPDLPLTGSGAVTGLPGAMADSAPDRWGRALISKREQARAREEGGAARLLGEVDFLLAVSDASRQGALRYRRGEGGSFLAADGDIPKLLDLPQLLHASDLVAGDGDDDFHSIKQLLQAGSASLGGARPKASVRDGDVLCIAKFPHPADGWDVMAWEHLALLLAARCGVSTPEHRLIDVGGRNVLLLQRFDRQGKERLPYISAMTLAGAHDGAESDYLEVAEALTDQGSAVHRDLVELFRRMALSVALHNTDDHLRNHGFLWREGGWALAPVFDINPNPELGAARVTSIAFETSPHRELDALFGCCAAFGLREPQAHAIWDEVRAAVTPWREVADALGIPEREQRRFAPVLDRFSMAG